MGKFGLYSRVLYMAYELDMSWNDERLITLNLIWYAGYWIVCIVQVIKIVDK